MNASDYSAVVYGGDVYCVRCLPKGINLDSDDVQPIFGGSEWDYIPTCIVCGEPIEYVQIIKYGVTL